MRKRELKKREQSDNKAKNIARKMKCNCNNLIDGAHMCVCSCQPTTHTGKMSIQNVQQQQQHKKNKHVNFFVHFLIYCVQLRTIVIEEEKKNKSSTQVTDTRKMWYMRMCLQSTFENLKIHTLQTRKINNFLRKFSNQRRYLFIFQLK